MKHRIYLRALEPDDYKVSVKWRNDDEIQNMVGGAKYFVSSEREKEWVHNAIFDNDKLVLAICLVENNEYIGNMIMHDINMLNRSCHISGMIGEKTYWSKGYFNEARMMMLRFAFYERGMERITASPLEDNVASLKSALSCGYKQEGVARQSVYKNGKFHNQILLSILREEFDQAYEAYCQKHK